ncbi:MAG: crossover junction endodeoxyribonuclease RuvC [Flavobacteriales bacterium]|nr:crossover junction endodeoxyribonuclease RuvC [Flavobacteriales bacterium]
MKNERIILGMDPGTNIMGYGIIKVEGKKFEMLSCGIIKLGKYPDHALRLRKIFDRVVSLIDEFTPDELSIEAPFYGKNVQSMLKLGRAQGVAIAAALSRDMPYREYAPRKIKQSITGNGNASKEQVAKMLQTILGLKELPESLDASDALAAAVCHGFQTRKGLETTSYASWKSFLTANPDRKRG